MAPYTLNPDPSAWPGVLPEWSHRLDVPSSASCDTACSYSWHYLDNEASLRQKGLRPLGSILAVHGNPTWSYVWRSLLAAASEPENPWRVIAVDQLDMGFSTRTGKVRGLADRVQDLADFTAALGLDETELPLLVAAHDWGGLISLGWALEHQQILSGILLTNTAVFHDQHRKIPAPLRLALHPAVHSWGTQSTSAFLDVTLGLVQAGGLDPAVRRAYKAPYRSPEDRAGIRNFVADIPVSSQASSYASMQEIAQGISKLQVPAFIQWGVKDPVFQLSHLADLQERLPQAQVHRYQEASHLLAEDVDIAQPIIDWLEEKFLWNQDGRQAQSAARQQVQTLREFEPLIEGLRSRAQDRSLAVVDMDAKDPNRVAAQRSWQQLAGDVNKVAYGLEKLGVGPGDRVNLLLKPGAKLTTLIYACLSIGAVIVVADSGLGPRGLTRALKGARPAYLIGDKTALLAAKTLGWPGKAIASQPLAKPVRRALGVIAELDDFTQDSPGSSYQPAADDLAAVLYTSGSTGPAKGVVYTQGQLAAMRDTIAAGYGLQPGAGLVAGFAPFALLGPALGVTSVTPSMDVTRPKTLSAQALASAAAAIDASTVFASPAALHNIVRTSSDLSSQQLQTLKKIQTVLSAGAPVSVSLLEAVAALMPQASIHTPYGMTEALPVTDISLVQIKQALEDAGVQGQPPAVIGAGAGVCVGLPLAGAQLAIAALDEKGVAAETLSQQPAVTGEIVVRAAHVKDHYDGLWVTERLSTRNPGWHRTGDVGHLDGAGRLWVEGRLDHVMLTSQGVLTPVAAEQAAELLPDVRRAGLVAVGPAGSAVPVLVIETEPRARHDGRVAPPLAARIRQQVADRTGIELAAVLVVREHPTDIRHNSKIDRKRLAVWAEQLLSGKKVGFKKC